MHPYINTYKNAGGSYLRVYRGTKICGRKVVTQKYYFFNQQEADRYVSYEEALEKATKAAIHAEKRHAQLAKVVHLRKARLGYFFTKTGKPTGLSCNISNRPGSKKVVYMTTRPLGGKVAPYKSKTLTYYDDGSNNFDEVFDLMFGYHLKNVGISPNDLTAMVAKGLLRSIFEAKLVGFHP